MIVVVYNRAAVYGAIRVVINEIQNSEIEPSSC